MTRETMEQIDALLGGSTTPEAFAGLQRVLRSDPVALAHYCRQAEIHGRLEWELGCRENQLSPVHIPTTASRRKLRVRWHQQPMVWGSLAAALAILMVVTLYRGTTGQGDTVAMEPAASLPRQPVSAGAPIARLTKSRQAQWRESDRPDSPWLPPGRMHLLSGTAEICLDSGARVILQGPAELELVSPFLARLLAGKATTHIPSQAAGFVLETPSSSFSDQDSSFAVAVAGDGSTEVHVIRGLVEATPRANPQLAKMLSKDQSLRLADDHILTGTHERHSILSFAADLPSPMDQPPSRYLHWPMDHAEQEQTAETGDHAGSDFRASILARPGTSENASADFIKGRFGNAVQLNGRGAFLSSGFPGIAGAQSRTVAFWVRIAPDTPVNHAYSMVAWGKPDAQEGGKWQITWNVDAHREGGQKGAVRTEFGGGYVIGSTDLRDGRWHHIAVVYLGGESTDVATHIRHYVDGQLEKITASKSKIINTSLIADESLPTYMGRRLENDHLSTGFKGALDEVYIFPAALTPQQINDLYLGNTAPR
ncbi:MAG: LamG domain-containing protein [Akkermansiaceae bacterium]|nr:LamG domain-containing protein [Akkermansiaceae bacterium]